MTGSFLRLALYCRRAPEAAGTEGRDGPTDAAGAIVDGRTWPAARAAGPDAGACETDPARDIA